MSCVADARALPERMLNRSKDSTVPDDLDVNVSLVAEEGLAAALARGR